MSRTKAAALPYQFHWSSSHAHIAWADLYNNGVLVEIAVVALDENNGDLYFIPIAALDTVDRERLLKIISKRDAGKYPLWDLMSNSTLKNGVNALEYFNQLVKGRSLSGQFFTPNSGRVGAGTVNFSARPNIANSPNVQPQQTQDAQEADYADAGQEDLQAAAPARRGPGRPPASNKR